MSEVRLVRCPKCDKVLPEPSGYPVYKCGGCGTFLRARKKSLASDGLLDGSVEEKLVNFGSGDSDKEDFVKEGSSITMDSETVFHGGLPKSPMRDRFLEGLVNTPPAMSSRDVSRSPVRVRGGSSGFDGDGVDLGARSSNVSKSPIRGRGTTPVSVRTRDVTRSPLRDSGSVGDAAAKASIDAWLPDDTRERQSGDNNNAGGRRSTWRDRAVYRPDQISGGVKSVLSDEHELTSERSFDDPIHGVGRDKRGMYQDWRFRSDHVVDGPSNNYSGQNNGYGDPMHSFESGRGPASVQERVELRGKYKGSGDQLSGLDDAEVLDESSRIRRGPMKQFSPNRNFQRPSQFHGGPGVADNRENMYNVNRPMYEDQYAGQMKRGPHSNQHFLNQEVPEYAPRRSSEYDQFPRDSSCDYPNDSRSRDQHSYSDNRRQGHLSANITYGHHMGHERYSPQAYDPTKMAYIGSQGQPSHIALQRKRVQVASVNKRLCRPISGGAPFVLCDNCFQLLIWPGIVIAKHKKQQLQCGTCSTLISIDLQKTKSSSDPLPTENKRDKVHEPDAPEQLINDSGPALLRDSSAAASTNVGSYDFDAGGYNFPSMGSEASSGTKGHTHSSSLPENTMGPTSLPSRFSMDERISDAHSSPLQQGAEKKIIDEETSREDRLHMTDATETDVHFSELPMTGLSHDSENISRGSSVLENDKVVQSHMDALLKGFASLSSHDSPVKAEVYVNGQPIPHRLVREAEKLAGPIEPGDYWYDPKAGFWGVMGHRCFGIIPPFIEEFRFPMPENCSRGDSNVFVNGRELQERDLNLLARRGLPTTRGMYYVVDISGRVVDEQTRDFVFNLGKLAPSVEKNKCGFGMQVPEQLDD